MLAQRIDALPGWQVLNEVQTAIGTVPLVAVGPAGVFAIDIAGDPAPELLAEVPERGLIHAWAQAKHLERRRVGMEVTPLLALDGTVAGRRRGVHVLPLASVDVWLHQLPAVLDPAHVELMLARLQSDAPRGLVLAA